MKTKLIFLVLLIICLSCVTNNKPVSDAQKEKIKREVKEAVNILNKGAEEANVDVFLAAFLDSPDFVYISNGKIFNYKESVDSTKIEGMVLKNQKCLKLDEKYVVLDNSTVLYTANSKWLMNLKDGSVVLQDPELLQILFRKTDSKWKILNFVESGSDKIVKYKEPSKELNQVELIKQYYGSWKGDNAKDTTVFYDAKSYGTGLEGYLRFVTKGKIVLEAKQLWGYDKNLDKYILTHELKGNNVEMYAFWFISKNKYEWISYSDIANPEMASFKIIGEFKSPKVVVETTVINNKTVRTDTYIRVK